MEIDWSKQHNGVHHCDIDAIKTLMPDVYPLIAETFIDNPSNFTWDVKVCMLMPRQYPCIPNWHCDNVPRINGIQDFSKIDLAKPMYLWISGPPLTQFKHGYVTPKTWIRFNQADEHRGTAASDFCWRGFIRGCHKDILPVKKVSHISEYIRRHTQVYLDATTFQW